MRRERAIAAAQLIRDSGEYLERRSVVAVPAESQMPERLADEQR